LDRWIVSALERSQADVPAALRRQVREKVESTTPVPRLRVWKRIVFWGPLLAAAALIVAFSLPLLYPPRAAEKKIAQIRTEFSIPDKNIKIIWVQRDDFQFPGTKG
jgi:hypothetical protein